MTPYDCMTIHVPIAILGHGWVAAALYALRGVDDGSERWLLNRQGLMAWLVVCLGAIYLVYCMVKVKFVVEDCRAVLFDSTESHLALT